MMLRICFCVSHYYPVASGAERQAHLQAVELSRRGHSVMVITRELQGSPAWESLDGVQIHRVIRPRQLGPVFGVSFVVTLYRALCRLANSYDLVHCHQGLWEAVATGLAKPRLAKPTVVQPAAGGEFGEYRQWMGTRGRRLLRRIMLRNSHFVAISQQIEREWLEFGVPRDRLTVLASGVDCDSFSPGPSAVERQLPPRPRVLFLGRLHPQKNLQILMQAWPAVRRRVKASLLLAGDGPQADLLREQARSLGIADSVHFLGAVQEPVEYLRSADVFVLPSVAEGMSNALLEAMAVGLPVIASRIGGNADLVEDGRTGLLVDAHDVAGWSEAIERLLENTGQIHQLGVAARELVSERFSVQTVVSRYLELYESLLSPR